MCVAVSKKAGVKIPSMEIFQQCFSRNRDGAGVVWLEDNKLHIEKGFMTFDAFKTFIEDLGNRIDTTNTLMGFHFRIKTHGEISRENTHPFPVSTNMSDLKQLSFETEGKVAIHNGMISRFDGTLKNSDTQEFITEFLAPLNKGVPNWESNDVLVKWVEEMLGSKMCVFNTDGTFKLLGNGWIEDEGVWYSNSSYKVSRYSSNTYLTSHYYGYGYNDSDYDDCECYTSYNSNKYATPILSSKEEKLLYYIDPNNSILLEDVDYLNKKYEFNKLNSAVNYIIAIDKDSTVYKYDIIKRVFVRKPNLRVVDTNTMDILKFDEKQALFEVVE